MTCRDALNLLPLFFDGELDAHQMRAVALHSTRCDHCEIELRHLERVQELVSAQIHAAVEEVDCTALWPAIDRRLGTIRVSWGTRLRAWWSAQEHAWFIQAPALAAVAALAVLALLVFARAPHSTTHPEASRVAAVDDAALINSLDADVDSVAVLNDPETHTTVLWVSDDSSMGGVAP
ncbi:MAG: anti-sigma factor family protein [Candidatus Binatia bacterium]